MFASLNLDTCIYLFAHLSYTSQVTFLNICKSTRHLLCHSQIKTMMIKNLIKELHLPCDLISKLDLDYDTIKQLGYIYNGCLIETNDKMNRTDLSIDFADMYITDYINILIQKNPTDKNLLHSLLDLCEFTPKLANTYDNYIMHNMGSVDLRLYRKFFYRRDHILLNTMKNMLVSSHPDTTLYILKHFQITNDILCYVLSDILANANYLEDSDTERKLQIILTHFLSQYNETIQDDLDYQQIMYFNLVVQDIIRYNKHDLLRDIIHFKNVHNVILYYSNYINHCIKYDNLKALDILYDNFVYDKQRGKIDQVLIIEPEKLQILFRQSNLDCLRFVCNLLGHTINSKMYVTAIRSGLQERKASHTEADQCRRNNLQILKTVLTPSNLQMINSFLPRHSQIEI